MTKRNIPHEDKEEIISDISVMLQEIIDSLFKESEEVCGTQEDENEPIMIDGYAYYGNMMGQIEELKEQIIRYINDKA